MPQISQIDDFYFSDPDAPTEDEDLDDAEPADIGQPSVAPIAPVVQIKQEAQETASLASVAAQAGDARLIKELQRDNDWLNDSLSHAQLRTAYAALRKESNELRTSQQPFQELSEGNRKLRAERLILELSRSSLQPSILQLEEQKTHLIQQGYDVAPAAPHGPVSVGQQQNNQTAQDAPPDNKPQLERPRVEISTAPPSERKSSTKTRMKIAQLPPKESSLVSGHNLRNRHKEEENKKGLSPEPSISKSLRGRRCGKCRQYFLRPEYYQDHLKTHHRKPLGYKKHVCPICGSAYTRSDNLTRHLNLVHTRAEDARVRPGQPYQRMYKGHKYNKKTVYNQTVTLANKPRLPMPNSKDIVQSDVN